jgi:hypothetical protein
MLAAVKQGNPELMNNPYLSNNTISHLKMDNIAKYFYLIFVKNEGNIPIFPEAFCEYQIKR